MEDIFNDIDKNKISEYHDYCHNSSSWPEKSSISQKYKDRTKESFLRTLDSVI